ncbi:methanethiol S-methyltransferase [Pseudomonas sp. B21-053]|uniref:methanethiol S-methyltransferase n=1 Tax=Pseudomonas sp. B21-053 TaxID=2895493 RepID=UPI002232B3D9|nr:methanethiol S-methyltransferase [Pseudomonas sp. B21-053]UZE10005.1 isoprenylcysteine carboxylmethyltransferase family protein [Pseudomonas sp. B21-053]
MKPNTTPEHQLSSLTGKLAGLLYSLCSYLLFLLTALYLIGFLSGLGVPKDINSGQGLSWPLAVIVDALLITLFAVQHSGMARQRFKRWWTTHIPAPIERATYVLSTCLVLILLFWLWQPIATPIWSVTSTWGHGLLMAVFWLGCFVVVLSTFLISHFELLGITQALSAWRSARPDNPTFKTPLLYKLVRHPLYLGFLIVFWATPDMTVGHLLFALLNTIYILIGAYLEEKDLVEMFGERYQRYQQNVAMLVPLIKRKPDRKKDA